MEDCCDFIQWLGADLSIKILMCLDNPTDLVRAGAVSSSWRQFVIMNGLSKQLCIRMFPEVANIANVIELNDEIEPLQNRYETPTGRLCFERENRVFAFLARGLTSFMRKDCMLEAVVASSTDNYPQEGIHNTLEPGDRVDQRACYWSSQGAVDPTVPETLAYKLTSNLCVITEIHIHPFQAYFQFGFPIYSAKAVRFRLGHLKPAYEFETEIKDKPLSALRFISENVVWTYTSPSFPMAQESRLQKFKLPEPALCIGGYLQIELLGRVQKQEMDAKYYICVCHVRAVGRPLSPAFDVDITDPSGKCTLKHYPDAEYCCSPTKSEGESSGSPSRFRSFTASIRGWEQMIRNTLLGGGAVVGHDDDSDEDDIVGMV
ncbi:F-box protein At4g00755-like [Bidens hawaiensis]|uniref:F-box protein At4g00755-like n=1 Tax=Bidens hawaiensis TaxID=980011 RepID=UPI00404B5E33